MTVAATGTNVVYQWQMSTNGTSWSNVTDGGAYSGSTASTLTITGATTSMTGYQFRALVSDANPCATETSSIATLTVSQPAVPTITASSLDYCAGSVVTLAAGNTSVNRYSNSFDSVSGFTGDSASVNTTLYSEGTGSILLTTSIASNNVNFTMNSDLNLSGLANATLTYSQIVGTEAGYDFAIPQYSSDGGSTWNTFPVANYTGSARTSVFNSGVRFTSASYSDWGYTAATTPSNSMWKTETISIPTLALTDKFRIRFRYTTDSSTNYYGWLIDNVKIATTNATVWSPVTGLYTNAAATILNVAASDSATRPIMSSVS
jgi:hypothetical protein